GEMYYAPDTDLNGNPRPSPAGTMPDKGCYEEILVDIDDIGSVPTGFQLYQNFPNPFNPLTSIRYTLPRPAEVNLVVYDILGQEVATLQAGFQTVGSYQTQWNGMDASGLGVSTGMYFCRLQVVDAATGGAGGFSETIKMVYLK
ncbi:MAG: T9SS type A sorting domain-containing protein, partial [FCB group bacterium]|nr:T9SS type A sorting domain-containing protein [FCB group bacterium]